MHKRIRVPLWGLMAAVAAAALLLLVVKPHWPGWMARYESWQRTRLILAQLERPIALRYPSGVGIEALLTEVMDSTRCDGLPSGIPIYVDEVALQSAGATLRSPVTIDVRDVPLKTSLRSAMGQYGLDYHVHDGLLEITGRDAVPRRRRPRRAGSRRGPRPPRPASGRSMGS